MNDEVILKGLKIIGRIPPGGRLCVHTNGTFVIESDNRWMTTLKRFLKGDSRVHCMDTVSKVINNAFILSQFYENHRFMDLNILKENVFNENAEMIIIENKRLIEKLQRIQRELNGARVGIVNLRDTTYSDDAEIFVILDIIIGEIDNRVSTIENKLQKSIYS